MTATDEQDERLGKGYPYTLRPELHKALRARGIDYWVAQGLTFWNCPDGRECVAYGYQSNGKPRLSVKIVGITDPEQAIEATLGRGTLTAEQVSRATYAHSIHADCADADWQAIADELNATLGSDDTFTREDVEGAFVSGYSLGLDMFDSSKTEKGWDQNKRNMDEEMEDLGWVRKDAATLGAGTCHEVEDEDTGFIVCSECGAVHDTDYTNYYCWCCGRKVVDE